MGRYYRMSKKVTEDQVKEIVRETLELEDVEVAEYEAETQLLKIVTKDNQFAGVMTRVVYLQQNRQRSRIIICKIFH